MREIKFRGRAKEPIPDKWFYGGYVRKGKKRTKHYIVNWDEKNMKLAQVDPKSVGQYTGLVDKNGTEIYEGGILTGLYHGFTPLKIVVRFGEYEQDGSGGEYGPSLCTGFYAETIDNRDDIDDYMKTTSLSDITDLEIIGNTFENPELLEVE